MENTEQLWLEFHERLLAFIRKRINDPFDAEDILHDVFLKIHKNIEKLANIKKIESWIFQITRNTIIDYYRKRKIHENLPEWLESETPEMEKSVLEDLNPCIRSLVDRLPKKYKAAVRMIDFEGKPQKDLARSERISLSGAKSRVQRGRAMLRSYLSSCCNIELKDELAGCDCIGDGCGE